MLGKYNTGERRGMLVIIGILAIIVALIYLMRNNSFNDNFPKETTDSIVKKLHPQAEIEEKASSTKIGKGNNKNKKKTKNIIRKKSQPKYEERNPLNENLPHD